MHVYMLLFHIIIELSFLPFPSRTHENSSEKKERAGHLTHTTIRESVSFAKAKESECMWDSETDRERERVRQKERKSLWEIVQVRVGQGIMQYI